MMRSAPWTHDTRRLSARRQSPLRAAFIANAGIAVSAVSRRATVVCRRASRTEYSKWSERDVRGVRVCGVCGVCGCAGCAGCAGVWGVRGVRVCGMCGVCGCVGCAGVWGVEAAFCFCCEER